MTTGSKRTSKNDTPLNRKRWLAVTDLLFFAAFLTFAVGLAHSVLGERYILIRLFRRTDIPHLSGGPEFTIRILRFAWHLTTVAWWGFAAILVLLAQQSV